MQFKIGADAALYSRKLMHHAYLELERFENVEDPYFYKYDQVDPVHILQNSYEKSMSEMMKDVTIYYFCFFHLILIRVFLVHLPLVLLSCVTQS